MDDQESGGTVQVLDIGGARGGKRGTPLSMVVTRELGEGDLKVLVERPPVGSTTPSITTLRSAHHLIAKLLADGIKQVEVSALTGYSQSRISILKGDPAFQELIEYYKTQKEAIYHDVHQRLSTLGLTAVEELQQRLEEAPEKLSNREVKEIAELALDRTGMGPKGSGGQGQGGGPAGGVSVTVQFVDAPQPTGVTIERQPQGPQVIDLEVEE